MVDSILSNEDHHCVVLYPGDDSINLSTLDSQQKEKLFPLNKKLVVFVLDGTWSTAKKTLARSQNLSHLPRICFTPTKTSNFRVRRQPKPYCYSTVEAIHQTIELVGGSRGFEVKQREHDHLLDIFNWLVENQMALSQKAADLNGGLSYRHKSRRSS